LTRVQVFFRKLNQQSSALDIALGPALDEQSRLLVAAVGLFVDLRPPFSFQHSTLVRVPELKLKQGDTYTESPLPQSLDVLNLEKWPAEIRRVHTPGEFFCICCSPVGGIRKN